MINDQKVGTLLFWFFFLVTVAWTLVAVLAKVWQLLKKKK
jgi:hypothetical protein